MCIYIHESISDTKVLYFLFLVPLITAMFVFFHFMYVSTNTLKQAHCSLNNFFFGLRCISTQMTIVFLYTYIHDRHTRLSFKGLAIDV